MHHFYSNSSVVLTAEQTNMSLVYWFSGRSLQRNGCRANEC